MGGGEENVVAILADPPGVIAGAVCAWPEKAARKRKKNRR
jgi:hypothetical protein